MVAVTHFSSLRTLDTAQFFRRCTEAAAVLTIHSRLHSAVRLQMYLSIWVFVLSLVEWRSLPRNNVHVKLHVQAGGMSFFIRFRSRASQAARIALERLDRRMRRWEKILGKNGCVELYVSGTKMVS